VHRQIPHILDTFIRKLIIFVISFSHDLIPIFGHVLSFMPKIMLDAEVWMKGPHRVIDGFRSRTSSVPSNFALHLICC